MRKFNLISMGIYTAFAGAFAYANGLPTGETIKHGEATINRTDNAMTIKQNSNVVSIDWESFNIGAQNSVEFQQPNALAVAHNRVTGGNASEIQGRLNANGRVFLSNPNGVIFSKTAEVNVGALLATTKELENNADNLDKRNFRFVRKIQEEGEVKNQGKITASGQNGFIVFVGDKVKNEGELKAKNFYQTKTERKRVCSGGERLAYYCDRGLYNMAWIEKDVTETISTPAQVILASGENFSLSLSNDKATAIYVELDNNSLSGIIENKGTIIAENGYIELTAQGQERALDAAVNNGILHATTANVRGDGKITLSAENIKLGDQSNIEAEKELSVTSPHRNKEVKIVSQKGSKILAEETYIKVDKLNFSGEFGRAESKSSNFYSPDTEKQRNKFNIEVKGKISFGDVKDENNAESFISNTALSSMLGNSGKVSLNSLPIITSDTKDFGGFKWTGDFNLNTYKESDAFLSLTTSDSIKIENANIQTHKGRLRIGTQLRDYKGQPFPETGRPNVNILNTTLNLGNGAIGIGRSGNPAYYLSNYKFVEDEARSYFDVNLDKVQLKNIDDFVIAGGMGNVNFNEVSHTGRSNFYIHGGNDRLFGKQKVWEYAIKDLEERIQRSEKDHDCERCRRWTLSSQLDEVYIPREFLDTYDSWIVAENRQHLDTQINMTKTNLNIKDGFLHLMAKNIHLKDSNINIDFDRNLKNDELHAKIHKLGLNGNTVLDNTHISVKGAEKAGVSPDKEFGVATFFSIGNMTGKNKSSIFAKSQEGYTVRTNGDATWKGEQDKTDLDVKILNLGIAYDPKKYEGRPFDITANYPELGNAGLTMAATPATVKLENMTVKVVTPNGAPAYHSSEKLKFETKDADFSYFERPRTQKQNEAAIQGETNKLTFTDEELAKEINKLNGVPEVPEVVEPTPPSTEPVASDTANSENTAPSESTESAPTTTPEVPVEEANSQPAATETAENDAAPVVPPVTSEVKPPVIEKPALEKPAIEKPTVKKAVTEKPAAKAPAPIQTDAKPKNSESEKHSDSALEKAIAENADSQKSHDSQAEKAAEKKKLPLSFADTLALAEFSSLKNITFEEKEVNLQVCAEGEECQDFHLGDQHNDARVNVGEVK